MPLVDPKLKNYGTPRQGEFIDAVNDLGSYRKAAKQFGLSPDAVRLSIKLLTESAPAKGYDPEGFRDPNLPAQFMLHGFTRHRDLRTGEDIQQWDKVKVDDQKRAAAILRAFESAADVLPRLKPVRGPRTSDADLLNLYTFTDYHLGMRAWAPESGRHWDIETAEDVLVRAFQNMLDRSPNAEVGFINQLGDFLHSDGLLPITPTSHNVLDQDVVYAQLVEAAIRVLRRLVDMALTKHKKVVVLMAEGNHDLASSVWLRALFAALYEKEPRVEVIKSQTPYYAYAWGVTMLGFHHGHKIKNEQLPGLFSSRYRLMWGTCTKVYIHTGHRHHLDQKDHQGARVIQHPTLAACDSHSARAGYDTDGQEAHVITYSRRCGYAGTISVNHEMLEAA